MLLWNYNFIHPAQKDFCIEFGKPQDLCTFLNKNLMRDTAFRTAGPAFLFMKTTAPVIFFAVQFLTDGMHKTFPTNIAFYFTGEATRIDGPIR